MAQVQSHLLSQQYEGMMKKANLRGIGGGMRWRLERLLRNYAGIVGLLEGIALLESYVKTLDTNKDKDEILVVLETNEL